MRNNTPSVIPVKLGIVKSFIVKDKKTVIVDTGYPGNAEKILRFLYKNLIKLEDVSLIILTHAHIDHYGSAEELREKTGAPIAIHKGDAEYIEKGINYIGTPIGLSARILKSFFVGAKGDLKAYPSPIPLPQGEGTKGRVKADIVFDDDEDLLEFGIDGRVIHTPGHTDGSVSLILPSTKTLAIVGDLMRGGILFNKKPHYPFFVSDILMLRESIRRIMKLSP
ncbi:MAG: MBL fold metallo-hydrolase, partial [Thermodesulfovibrionia bacterium]|nr:MBL fold metallo-hydrolase [Thermodesulfovibrionia bacterium]